MPTFTRDFFSNHKQNWLKIVAPRIPDHPSTWWLEVGSYEGQSALWTAENILRGEHPMLVCVDTFDPNTPKFDQWAGNHDYESTFDRNMAETPHVKVRGRGEDVLPSLLVKWGACFRGAYLDSDHSTRALRLEAPLVWSLLSPGGISIFDDYDSPYDPGAKAALDEFLDTHRGEYEILLRDFQLILQKKG